MLTFHQVSVYLFAVTCVLIIVGPLVRISVGIILASEDIPDLNSQYYEICYSLLAISLVVGAITYVS